MVAPCALVLFAAGDTAACAAFVGAGLGMAVGVVGAWANTLHADSTSRMVMAAINFLIVSPCGLCVSRFTLITTPAAVRFHAD